MSPVTMTPQVAVAKKGSALGYIKIPQAIYDAAPKGRYELWEGEVQAAPPPPERPVQEVAERPAPTSSGPKPIMVETVAVVKADSPLGYMLVARSDFDPDEHEPYKGELVVEAPTPAPPPKVVERTVLGPSVVMVEQVAVEKADSELGYKLISREEFEAGDYEEFVIPEGDDGEEAEAEWDEASLGAHMATLTNKALLAEFAMSEFGVELDGEAKQGEEGYVTRSEMERAVMVGSGLVEGDEDDEDEGEGD